MEDYQSIEFHQLVKNEQDFQKPENENASFEGCACTECKECPGFTQHAWRKGCGNCKCPVWAHEIPVSSSLHPFDSMNAHEKMAPNQTEYEKASSEGYSWVPRGLRSSQIKTYMESLPEEMVPASKRDGAKRRARQLMYQIPPQDFNSKFCKFLKQDSQWHFDEMRSICIEEGAGVGGVRSALTTAMPCAGCGETIASGQMAVFAERFGPNTCWHPQCFTCCCCDQLLVDNIYFMYDDKLYCARHWAEQIKPRCSGCEELIYIGEFTRAMDKAWHLEHFCCWTCDVPMTGKKYIIVNEKPICMNCYEKNVANICYACKKPIGPECKDLFVKDRHYHKECLVCSQCGEGLESLNFSFVDDKGICHACRGIDPEKSKVCTACGEAFEATEKKVGTNNEYYHERCFTCDMCQKPIGADQFIKKNNGRRLCNLCFEDIADRCAICQGIIKGSTVKFEDTPFHPECFVCQHCSKELGGLQFYKHQDSPYCEECYVENYAKRCNSCGKAIEGNSKFVAFEGKHWHSECFVCATCETCLAGEKFVIREGKRICLNCK